MAIFIGLLSGTSMDGVDACMVDFSPTAGVKLLAHHTTPYPDDLLRELCELMRGDAPGAMQRTARLDAWLGEFFAACANTLIEQSGVDRGQIRAIGSHGQTVHHAPNIDYPYSLQLGDPHRIAERCGLTVVADFRRRDIAAGGQGAPLVPPVHAALFADAFEHRVVANIGGIANVTLLPAKHALDTRIRGFDTGPGNTLMDAWIQRHQGLRYDHDGAWAAQGTPDEGLINTLLADDFFAQPAPKSTGPELFNLDWLEMRAAERLKHLPAADVQATLLELTARSLIRAIREYAPATERVLVCGGGAYNTRLMTRLSQLANPIIVESTASHGVAPAWVEAVAFAWLARQTLNHQPGNLPDVTGARGLRVLGAIYPPTPPMTT